MKLQLTDVTIVTADGGNHGVESDRRWKHYDTGYLYESLSHWWVFQHGSGAVGGYVRWGGGVGHKMYAGCGDGRSQWKEYQEEYK